MADAHGRARHAAPRLNPMRHFRAEWAIRRAARKVAPSIHPGRLRFFGFSSDGAPAGRGFRRLDRPMPVGSAQRLGRRVELALLSMILPGRQLQDLQCRQTGLIGDAGSSVRGSFIHSIIIPRRPLPAGKRSTGWSVNMAGNRSHIMPLRRKRIIFCPSVNHAITGVQGARHAVCPLPPAMTAVRAQHAAPLRTIRLLPLPLNPPCPSNP